MLKFLKRFLLWLFLFICIWVVLNFFPIGRVVLAVLLVYTLWNWRRRGYPLKSLLWR